VLADVHWIHEVQTTNQNKFYTYAKELCFDKRGRYLLSHCAYLQFHRAKLWAAIQTQSVNYTLLA